MGYGFRNKVKRQPSTAMLYPKFKLHYNYALNFYR